MVINPSDTLRNFWAFGITLSSDLPLDSWLQRSDAHAELIVTSHFASGEVYTPDSHPIFTHPLRDKLGYPNSHIYRIGELLYFRLPSLGVYFLSQDKIHIEINPMTDLPTVCATLLSTILSLWLELRQIRCLHASCLAINNRAAAFMGDSTTGKSTISAALLKTGADLLSDDIVPIQNTQEGFLASPSYPFLRLSLKQVKKFLGGRSGVAQWCPVLGKALVPIGGNGWGTYCETQKKIQRLYILNRCSNISDNTIRFENLSQTASVLALIRHSFILHTPYALGIATERMEFFAKLVEDVSVTKLTYPSGYTYLPKITELIRQNMQAANNP